MPTYPWYHSAGSHGLVNFCTDLCYPGIDEIDNVAPEGTFIQLSDLRNVHAGSAFVDVYPQTFKNDLAAGLITPDEWQATSTGRRQPLFREETLLSYQDALAERGLYAARERRAAGE